MAGIGYVDLHTHTTASDGLHMPADNVRMAKAKGLAGIAITDHDTTAGIDEAVKEGEKLGIIVVPGVEISTVLYGMDIHVLGYNMDIRNPLFQERLEAQRNTRERRNVMMIERLRSLNIPITMEDVRQVAARKSKEETIGRPHFAEVLIKLGVVATMQEAFDRYLAKGAAAYVSLPRIRPEEAVAWIREAGGKAVLAHPGIYGDDDAVREIIQAGVDGLEVYHSDHSPEQERAYLSLAKTHELIITAGSDFHGSRGGEVFHGEIGNRRIEQSVLEQLGSKSCNRAK